MKTRGVVLDSELERTKWLLRKIRFRMSRFFIRLGNRLKPDPAGE